MGDNLTPLDFDARIVSSIESGISHSCVLFEGGVAACWGNNGFGELGLGLSGNRGDQGGEMGEDLLTINPGSGRTVAAVGAGNETSCALLDDDSIKCWGANDFGQLGRGNLDHYGRESGETVDQLDPVNLGAGRTASAVSVGGLHVCAILDNGSVKCWGNNTNGKLGLEVAGDRGGVGDAMGDTLAPVDLGAGRTARSIAAGANHTCAILDDQTLKCWGDNFFGQLGQDDADSRGLADNMGDALEPIDLGTDRQALAVSVGTSFTCALLDGGEVKCWGVNQQGQLGQGDTDPRGGSDGDMANLEPIDLGSGRTALSIAAGTTHACAVLDDGAVKCWGDNSAGQLGQGDSDHRGDGGGEMGDALDPVSL
jgi:alpha-tubulin suppressor-like RCC1 family protein